MFTIDRLGELHAETIGMFTVEYTPASPREAKLKIIAPLDAVRVTRVEATLLDGTVLAAGVRSHRRNAASITTVDLGYLELPVRVSISLQAVVPVCVSQTAIQISVDDLSEVMNVTLTGQAKFVPSRSVVRFSEGQLRPGGSVDVEVALVNDGTAVASGARLYVRPPAWTNVDADGARRELHRDDGPVLVVPLPEIPVGATSSHRFRATLAPIIRDGTPIVFEAFVMHDDRRFDLTPASGVVHSEATLQASVRLTEERAFRYGDHVAALVTLRALGSDVMRGVRVSLACPAIAWNDAGTDGALVLDFGEIPPLTDTVHLVQGTVIATPARAQQLNLSLTADAQAGSVDTVGCPISVSGAPQITSTLAVHELPDESAYEVVCAIHNDGDGEASSVVVRSERRDGMVGVVDSLVIDGRSRLSLDGSLAVEGNGVEVGALAILSSREVRWKLRSSVDQAVALAVELVVDGTALVIDAPTRTFSAGHRDQYSAPRAALATPALTEPAIAAPIMPVEPAEITAEPPAAATVAERVVDAGAEEASVSDAVEFEVGDTTISRWKAWFGEQGPSADVELGRYVLAAREFLPVHANGADQDASLAAIRTECNAVVTARLFSWKSTGAVGASGYDFATPTLRSNVASFWSLLGQPQSNLDGARLDLAIVALTAANGTPFASEVEAFRDRLIEVLEGINSVEAYGNAATDIQPAASRLFNAMCDLGVAA